MDRLSLKAQERVILGKKVKKLRRDGIIPGHVYGNQVESEHVAVALKDFLPVLHQAGETGLIDLKIGEEKVRPVLVRGLQHDSITGSLLHIDFYQVNLKEKVRVPVPIELVGEEPEGVHLGEVVVLQNLHEVEVEALPTDLIEKIEVDISSLKNIEDAILVGQLNFDREKLTVLANPEEVVVKLAPAITEEMKKLMEEQEAEAAAAAAAEAEAEGVEAPAEGEEVATAEEGEAIEQEVTGPQEKSSEKTPETEEN